MRFDLTVGRALLVLCLTTLLLSGCQDGPLSLEDHADAVADATLNAMPADMDTIRNAHIVLLRRNVESVESAVSELIPIMGAKPYYVYRHALKGFAVANLSSGAIERLSRHALVELIEEDTHGRRATTDWLGNDSALWGLDRIDQQSGEDSSFSYFKSGSDVHIYIVDSGIMGGHQEFSGRLGTGVSFIKFSSGANPYIDAKGHGTSVASVAAGTTFGVAKDAILHSVRINDAVGSHWTSDMVAGLDWVAANAIDPAVVNISLNDDARSVSSAIDGLNSAGISVVLAAGNDNSDACDISELNNTKAIRVSALDHGDVRASFANFGTCIDIFAPGVSLRAARKDFATDNHLVSGTSIAAPLVTGVVAAILEGHPNAIPFWVKDLVVQSAAAVTPNLGSGSPQRVVQSLFRHIDLLGPIFIDTAIDSGATYHAQGVGGDGTWSWQWETSTNGAAYTTVGSGPSYFLALGPFSGGNVSIRLTGTSFGEARVSTRFVEFAPCIGDPSGPC